MSLGTRVAAAAFLVLMLPACLAARASSSNDTGTDACLPSGLTLCGQPCKPCASICASCEQQGTWCGDSGHVFQCGSSGICYTQIKTCSAPDACVSAASGARCAESVDDCPAIRAAYEARVDAYYGIVVRPGSTGPAPAAYPAGCTASCGAVAGDCAVGLDTCWFVGQPDSELQRLATLYSRFGCPALSACDCPSSNVQFECDAGKCVVP